MNFNPILVREVRARWRRWPAMVIVFGYAIVLAVTAGFIYDGIAGDANWTETAAGEPPMSSSRFGHDLFMQMSWMQGVAWVLIAPALTVTSIASERERGLMESLHLAPLSPMQIVWGKLWSALSFIGLMLLVPLPVAAICFLLGGVSPGEFLSSLLLQAGTAAAFAALGLMASALARRSTEAVVLGACLVGAMLYSGMFMMSFIWGFASLFLGSWLPLVLTLGVLIAVTLLCLKAAASMLLKPLPPVTPSLPALSPSARSTPAVAGGAQVAAGTQNAAPHHPAPALPTKRREPSHLPLPSFGNPLLQREVPRRLQLPLGFRVESPLLALFFIMVGFGCIIAVYEPDWRAGIWFTFCTLWMFAAVLIGTLAGATAFPREREAGTLESLFLSVLTPLDILVGKAAAPLLTCFTVGLPLFPLLILCLSVWSSQEGIGISLRQAVLTFLLLATTSWCSVAGGLCCGWFFRRIMPALCAASALVLFGLMVLPALLPLLAYLTPDISNWYPFVAFWRLYEPDRPGVLRDAEIASLLLFTTGSGLFGLLYSAMRHGTRERDRLRR